jgi:hypothetical protein
MSNRYRKEEPQQPSRVEMLIEARVTLQSAAQQDGGARVSVLLAAEYKRRGGDQIDSQIEGMLLVVEEGKIYRRAALRYAAEMERFHTGLRKDAPARPEPSEVSPATMVSAAREFERLEARRQEITEESELTIAAQISADQPNLRPRRQQEPHTDAAAQNAPQEAQNQTEAKPATPGKAAATAAA